MRKKIYQMVHIYTGHVSSVVYKYFMIAVILLSLVPLTVKEDLAIFRAMELLCLGIFGLDYLLRWSTADYKFRDKRWVAFARYPFRLISLVDLMSIFALLCSVQNWLVDVKIAQVLTVFRLIRILRSHSGN